MRAEPCLLRTGRSLRGLYVRKAGIDFPARVREPERRRAGWQMCLPCHEGRRQERDGEERPRWGGSAGNTGNGRQKKPPAETARG